MEELEKFAEGKGIQPDLHARITSNGVSRNVTEPLIDSTSLVDESKNTFEDCDDVAHSRVRPDLSQKGDEVEKEVNSNSYSNSNEVSSDLNPQPIMDQQSSVAEEAVSVAALLQHATDEATPQRNGNLLSESNEEGYDSEDEEINDAKLLEFMLRDSQSQEDFHQQYDELTSSIQDQSPGKIQSETNGLSEMHVPNTDGSVNSSGVVTDDSVQNEKQCWVCFASEEDDTSAIWTSPCR